MRKIILTILVGIGLVAVATLVLKDASESSSWFTLDTLFHFVGGVYTAWCASLFARRPASIFFGALMIGLAWELAECASSVYGPTYWPEVSRYYHTGGLIDTIHDLFADILGTISFILLYCRHEKEK